MNFVTDAVRFALHNKCTIENAPLQAYTSALLFSPINSLVRREFSREEPIWASLKPIVETSWRPCMQTLEGHSSSVRSVTFSGDGQHIVSESSDSTVKVWDTQAGGCAQTLDGHSDWVLSVVFSPDGQHIVSGSGDSTIKIWDMQTGRCLQALEGHHLYVLSIAFSADCQYVVSASSDTTIKI